MPIARNIVAGAVSALSRLSGRPVDVDGRYGPQCVDAARRYLSLLGWDPYRVIPPISGARQAWDVADRGYLQRIPWTGRQLAVQRGDIAVWSGRLNGRDGRLGPGHIAIAATDHIAAGAIDVWDQNWGGQTIHRAWRPTRHLLGVLRPITTTPPPDPARTPATGVRQRPRYRLARTTHFRARPDTSARIIATYSAGAELVGTVSDSGQPVTEHGYTLCVNGQGQYGWLYTRNLTRI